MQRFCKNCSQKRVWHLHRATGTLSLAEGSAPGTCCGGSGPLTWGAHNVLTPTWILPLTPMSLNSCKSASSRRQLGSSEICSAPGEVLGLSPRFWLYSVCSRKGRCRRDAAQHRSLPPPRELLQLQGSKNRTDPAAVGEPTAETSEEMETAPIPASSLLQCRGSGTARFPLLFCF